MSTVDGNRNARSEQQPASDPLLQEMAPDRRLELEGLGLPITIETNDARVERVARQAFAERRRSIESDFSLHLRLLVHDVPEEQSWTPVQPVLRGQGDYFYAAASRASVVAGDCRSGFAFGFISNDQADHEEHLRSTLLQSPILWMATSKSLSSIHCAVVTLNGKSVMLRGKPNAGKTTLAYAAVRRGFSLLCEDVAFAWESAGGIELRGLPWLLYLKPDAVRFFPELDDLEPLDRYNGERKILVQMAERFPSRTVQKSSFGPIVFIERSPNGSNELYPIARDDALQRLEETRIAMEHRRAKGVDVWGRMLEHPVYHFEVGPDPMAAAAVLEELCAS